MNFFARIFGAKPGVAAKPEAASKPVMKAAVRPVEHAVIVKFSYGGSRDLDPIFTLAGKLCLAISAAKAGEYDGHEVAADGRDGTLYMYGPDADKLFEAVRAVLESCCFMKGAVAKLRYGPPAEGVRKREVRLAA